MTTAALIGQPPKFGRNYQIYVQPDAAAAAINGNTNALPINIALPFTLELDITRNIQNSANTCQLRIWNLAQGTRNQIRFDRTNYAVNRGVILKAGYGLNPAVVFSGNITQAWSVREGVNYVTTIECFVGGAAYINAHYDRVWAAGTPIQAIVQDMVSSLSSYGISVGAIGSYLGVLPMQTTISGNTMELLKTYTGGAAFIDQLKANCLNNGEYIANLGGITTVTSDSGLLGTPIQEQLLLTFDMIFEPRLNPGQLVVLQSLTENNFNGTYKCISVKHRGMISAAKCDAVITTVGLQYIKDPTSVFSQNPSTPAVQ